MYEVDPNGLLLNIMFNLYNKYVAVNAVNSRIELCDWPEVGVVLERSGIKQDYQVVHWRFNSTLSQESSILSLDIHMATGLIQLIQLIGKFHRIAPVEHGAFALTHGDPCVNLDGWMDVATPMVIGDVRGSLVDCYGKMGMWIKERQVGLSFCIGKVSNRIYLSKTIAFEFDEDKMLVGLLFDSLESKELRCFEAIIES